MRLVEPGVSGDRPLLEQLQASPSLLWMGPHLGLGRPETMELLCLVGALLSLGAALLEPLRDSLVFLVLWGLYLSLCQVGTVCVCGNALKDQKKKKNRTPSFISLNLFCQQVGQAFLRFAW